MYTPCSVTWRTATATASLPPYGQSLGRRRQGVDSLATLAQLVTATLTPPVRSSINSWAKIGSNATPWER